PRPEVGGGQWTEGFLTKLGPEGELAYSTYFGGLPGSTGDVLAGTRLMDVATIGGGAVITGYSGMADDPATPELEGLPVGKGLNTNVAQPRLAGSVDAFVAVFNQDGVLN